MNILATDTLRFNRFISLARQLDETYGRGVRDFFGAEVLVAFAGFDALASSTAAVTSSLITSLRFLPLAAAMRSISARISGGRRTVTAGARPFSLTLRGLPIFFSALSCT